MLGMAENDLDQQRTFTDPERSEPLNEEINKLIDLQVIDSEIDSFDQQIDVKEQEIISREQFDLFELFRLINLCSD